jgi:hypothetical protein
MVQWSLPFGSRRDFIARIESRGSLTVTFSRQKGRYFYSSVLGVNKMSTSYHLFLSYHLPCLTSEELLLCRPKIDIGAIISHDSSVVQSEHLPILHLVPLTLFIEFQELLEMKRMEGEGRGGWIRGQSKEFQRELFICTFFPL